MYNVLHWIFLDACIFPFFHSIFGECIPEWMPKSCITCVVPSIVTHMIRHINRNWAQQVHIFYSMLCIVYFRPTVIVCNIKSWRWFVCRYIPFKCDFTIYKWWPYIYQWWCAWNLNEDSKKITVVNSYKQALLMW